MGSSLFSVWKRKIQHEPRRFVLQSMIFLVLFLLLFTLRILLGSIRDAQSGVESGCQGSWNGLWAEALLMTDPGHPTYFPEEFLRDMEGREEIRELRKTRVCYVSPGNYQLPFDKEELLHSPLYLIMQADQVQEEAAASLGKMMGLDNLEDFNLLQSKNLILADEDTALTFSKNPKGVVVSEDLLKRNHLVPGDSLEVWAGDKKVSLEIAGSFWVPVSSTYYVREDYRNLLLVPQEVMDKVLEDTGEQEKVTAFQAVFSSASHMEQIVDRIKEQWPEVFQKFYSYLNDTQYQNQKTLLQGLSFYVTLIQVVLIAVYLLVSGLYAYFLSLGRRKEMGIWISLGEKRARLVWLEFLELGAEAAAGMLLGAMGSGLLAGFLRERLWFLQGEFLNTGSFPAGKDFIFAAVFLLLTALGSAVFSVFMSTKADSRTLLAD